MTTHIMFPTIDPEYPATLSKRVITGLLREELGYKGVVTTDCMEMKAIADNFGSGESAVLAVEAGVDLVLACHTLSIQREMHEALLKAVKDGRISEEKIDRSIERIMALKDKYRLESRRTVDTTRVAATLADPDHKALQMEIARRSVTLVRNREDIVPLDVCDKCKIAVVGTHHSVTTFADSLRKYHSNTEVIEVDGSIEEAVRRASEASVVIAVSCPSEPWTKPVDEKLREYFCVLLDRHTRAPEQVNMRCAEEFAVPVLVVVNRPARKSGSRDCDFGHRFVEADLAKKDLRLTALPEKRAFRDTKSALRAFQAR
jgi:beta-glucosidase-like glycosyl hydrolase